MGGPPCSETYGGCRLELARLSKLCLVGWVGCVVCVGGGSPSSRISQPSGGCGFWVTITVWLGGRGGLSVISRRNVICVFAAQRGLSQASTLNPAALNISRLQLAISGKEEWERERERERAWTPSVCLTARASAWVGERRCGGFVQ